MQPCADGRRLGTTVREFSTWGGLVDVVLYNGRPDEGCGNAKEPGKYAAQRAEVNFGSTEARVNDLVKDRDHGDQDNRVEVGEEVVRKSCEMMLVTMQSNTHDPGNKANTYRDTSS